MTDAQSAQTALDKLIEAVEAGDLATVSAHMIREGTGQHCQLHFVKAHHGSLDAALALHEALLPGWRARLDIGCRRRCWMISPDNQKLDAYAPTPARAWLLAILRAYRSTQK